MLKCRWLRNFYRMCIDYAFRPHLSSRLTLGGQPFPRKPQTFDHYDSHIILVTHSGILSRISSTPASADASPYNTTLPYPNTCVFARASVVCLAPLHLRRRPTRPVSYYALFECVAASEPTSWLFSHFYILFHLAYIWDLNCRSGLFPF